MPDVSQQRFLEPMDAISSDVHGLTKHAISVFYHRLALMGFDNSVSDRHSDECQEDALLLMSTDIMGVNI
jgi:hypothetical protein